MVCGACDLFASVLPRPRARLNKLLLGEHPKAGDATVAKQTLHAHRGGS